MPSSMCVSVLTVKHSYSNVSVSQTADGEKTLLLVGSLSFSRNSEVELSISAMCAARCCAAVRGGQALCAAMLHNIQRE